MNPLLRLATLVMQKSGKQFLRGIIENVESDTSKAKIARNVENEGIVVYPSRFSPLLGIDEENEVEVEELGKELEDGEIIASKVEGKKTQ